LMVTKLKVFLKERLWLVMLLFGMVSLLKKRMVNR